MSEIRRRVFLVGCPRSGTTLLQSMLASHPEVHSFPESHFFRLLPARRTWWRLLGFASPRVLDQARKFLDQVQRPDLFERLPRNARFVGPYCRAFIGILDELCRDAGKTSWLEKTPDHVHRIRLLTRYVSGVRFVHIVRDGRDVVASLHEVTHAYPDVWGKPWTIDYCIRKWNRDIDVTRAHVGRQGHFVVRYERLLEDADATLESLCGFLELPYEREMMSRRDDVVDAIVANEPWKSNVGGAVAKAKVSKFERIFDDEQRNYIESRLQSSSDL